MVTKIYKIRSEICLAPFPLTFGGPNASKFRRDFAQLRDLIANISVTQQDIVDHICYMLRSVNMLILNEYDDDGDDDGKRRANYGHSSTDKT